MLQRAPQQTEGREAQLEHNGLLPHGHTNSEAGKVTLQLQVSYQTSLRLEDGVKCLHTVASLQQLYFHGPQRNDKTYHS